MVCFTHLLMLLGLAPAFTIALPRPESDELPPLPTTDLRDYDRVGDVIGENGRGHICYTYPMKKVDDQVRCYDPNLQCYHNYEQNKKMHEICSHRNQWFWGVPPSVCSHPVDIIDYCYYQADPGITTYEQANNAT